jgi:ankyrin repeat protein
MCLVVEGGRLFSDARCCRDGEAPIQRAASGGHLSCLEFLVGRNADVNAQTK